MSLDAFEVIMISMKAIKFSVFIFIFLITVLSIHPGRFATHYDYVEQADLWENLVKRTSKNATFRAAPACDYVSILSDNSDVDAAAASPEYSLDTKNIRTGGEFVPVDCKPLFSTAIIVPYRDRDVQLKTFLTYMHEFLKRQNVHYRIYIVEQDDAKSFNRAKLLNVGAKIAIAHGFPCIILHDVDLLPLKQNNMYACTKLPRHMSSSIDKFRFNLPYKTLFGGAVSLLSEQFKAANGMSNNYFGWGAEDDDFYQRLDSVQLIPCRLSPEVSSYTMMKHKKEVPGSMKNNLLVTARQRFLNDGLNSLKYTEKTFKLHTLFTHIVVAL